MQIVHLTEEWEIISKLNVGGFGTIYSAKSKTCENAVLKLIPKKPGAGRELLFEKIGGQPNIMPILDTGEWEDFWVIVMPRAEKSLRDFLNESGGKLEQDEAVLVLIDIATALEALQNNDVVHRDLKPENVLFWEGHWRLADFGIARYASATTDTATWKYAMTLPYAAPEQWRSERATSATDIYATGILAYELIMGKCPFIGPSEHDYRGQHLHHDAPLPTGCSSSLAALIGECMFKSPQTRPTASNALTRLKSLQKPESEVSRRLREVNKAAVLERAKQDASISAVKSELEHRNQLAKDANKSLESILGTLKDQLVRELSQGILRESAFNSWQFSLNQITLSCSGFQTVAAAVLNSPGFPAPFEVIGFSAIVLQIPADQHGYGGRSHSLWFCDAENKDIFRWYETAFMFFALSGKQGSKDPFALEPDAKAGRTLAPIYGTEFQIAWPFTPIDQGETNDFIERWMGWFADAYEGKLRHPRSMPERDPSNSWRKK